MDLNWVEVGDPDSDQVVVFLHEGLGCVEMWKDYPEKLCNQNNLKGVIYDRSGYGKSPGSLLNRDKNYLHQAAEELEYLLNHLTINNPILYGHSDGGSIALIHAGQNPGKAKMVITEAAHVFNEAETIQGVKEARPWLKEGKMEGLKKYHGNRYKEVFYAWNDIWLDPSFKNWDITNLLTNIKVPVLVIQGKNDNYGTLKQVNAIVSGVEGAVETLTPDNCGHAPFKEQTAIVMSKASAFIDENK
ncbi:MAG: alpha/beta hydrolase [Crocinitomicaceae bacterium]|nr:alpha/beta hydrolase [Crocinitomicaceae bacterium]